MRRSTWKPLAGVAVCAVLLGSGLAWLTVAHPHALSTLRGRLAAIAPGQPGIPAGPGSATVRFDTAAAGSPISPLVYGVAAAGPDVVRALGATVDRWGGNPSSRYNWANGHAWNAGRDWEFRNVDYAGGGGSAADAAVAAELGAGATPLLTVPALGFVARDDRSATRSTGVPAQGGPSVRPGSPAIGGYDPTAK